MNKLEVGYSDHICNVGELLEILQNSKPDALVAIEGADLRLYTYPDGSISFEFCYEDG